MSTEHESALSTLLREHVRAEEPPLGISADASILAGRRALRRRRARHGALSLALVGAAAAVVAPMVLSGSTAPKDDGVDPATAAALKNYDAAAMPQVLRRAVDPVVARSAPDLIGTSALTVSDGEGAPLPPKYWDKASGMDFEYGGTGDHRLRVSLLHSRSEAEGNARESCENDVATGYAFSCDVRVIDGDVVTTRVYAVRRLDDDFGEVGWSWVTREELRTGKVIKSDPSQRPIDRDEIYFHRSTESVHSETFLTLAQETVKARSYPAAKTAFTIPLGDLVDLATDPSLVIPRPPKGANGCGWMLHQENGSCEVEPTKG